jgi:glycosyltransferase involved in cell wall biosynthesis
MNIIHLHWKFNIGGAETHIFELALIQKKLNLNPIVVCQKLYNTTYKDQFKLHDIPFYVTEEETQVINLINEHSIDIIHAHSSFMYSIAVSIAEKTGKPLVGTLHGIKSIEKKRADEMHEYIAVSKEVYYKVISKYPNLSITVIENAINQDNFKPEPKNMLPTLAYVGRIDAGKINGVLCLHKGINALKKRVNFISASTLKEKRFKGIYGKLVKNMVDASKVLNNTDIVIGTGRAIREGMSAGNVGIVLGKYYDGIVIPDNVESLQYSNFSGRKSYNVPNTNDLIKDIRKLIDNPLRLEKLKIWSYQHARDNFGMQSAYEKHIEVYSKVLNRDITSPKK